MQLTAHFTLEELTRSEIALRNNIQNTPDADTIENLKVLASGLEEVRAIVSGFGIHVNSAYRCEAVERILCEKAFQAWATKRGKPMNTASWKEYFAGKAHPQGFAADIVVPSFGTPKEVCYKIKESGIRFDQLIFEFASWCHISFAPALRMQVLTIDGTGTRQGIV